MRVAAEVKKQAGMGHDQDVLLSQLLLVFA
jgi:hypothetical protein